MGLIQIWQRSKIGKIVKRVDSFFARKRYNRRMRKAVKILNKCAPYYIKQIGTDKNGTVRQVKDLNFNMKRNAFEPKMRKIARGLKTNVHHGNAK